MTEHFDHLVSEQEQGVRLDAFIANLGIEAIASRSAVARLIDAGLVTLNGAPSTKKRLVMAGDVISIDVPPRSGVNLNVIEPAYDIPLDIRYEDEHLIVLSKQAGLVCHPARGHYDDTLANALVAHCGGKKKLACVQGEDRPGIVHRLDRDTSGLMLAAKSDVAAAKLQDDIRNRLVDRHYCTLVHGNIGPDTGMVDAPIAREVKDRTRMAVSNDETARNAITTFTVLERFEAGKFDDGYTLLECKLYTGRTHQIRVHMAYTQHPVVGDPLYGRGVNAKARMREKAIKSEMGLERQFLHSLSIRFTHPVTGEELSFTDTLPDDLQGILDGLAGRSVGRTARGHEILG